MLVDTGDHLRACKVSVDMMDLNADDLCNGVEDIINVSEFIELSEGAQILFV
jgi:peroxiredoxin family protein